MNSPASARTGLASIRYLLMAFAFLFVAATALCGWMLVTSHDVIFVVLGAAALVGAVGTGVRPDTHRPCTRLRFKDQPPAGDAEAIQRVKAGLAVPRQQLRRSAQAADPTRWASRTWPGPPQRATRYYRIPVFGDTV